MVEENSIIPKKKNKSLPVHVMKTYRGSGCVFPLIFTSALDIGYWSALGLCRSTTGNDPRYLLHKILEGPQVLSGRCGEGIDRLLLSGVEPQFLACTAHSLVAMLTELFQ